MWAVRLKDALMDANQGPDLPPPIRLAANDR